MINKDALKDCISRAKTCDYIAEFINHEYSTQSECEMIDAMIEGIQHLPSVKPKPKTGNWIKITPAGIYECSECRQNIMTSDICAYKYCHGCGAKMESEDAISRREAIKKFTYNHKGERIPDYDCDNFPTH